ncbi:hypothetical protein JHK85_010049 [Glycine max]|nr:hypothetical protein JHK87_009658 [Glycine soja]KAG5048946.1 hypothetical protein JHK85_010049 [Glycine max]
MKWAPPETKPYAPGPLENAFVDILEDDDEELPLAKLRKVPVKCLNGTVVDEASD